MAKEKVESENGKVRIPNFGISPFHFVLCHYLSHLNFLDL